MDSGSRDTRLRIDRQRVVDGKHRPAYAHRLAWELTHGPIPHGLNRVAVSGSVMTSLLLLLLLTVLAMGCAHRCTTRLYAWTDYDDQGKPIGYRQVPLTVCRLASGATNRIGDAGHDKD